jgi:ABC-type transporter lipoprotein component MlaA/predicted alpha/beta-fold hydrolase
MPALFIAGCASTPSPSAVDSKTTLVDHKTAEQPAKNTSNLDMNNASAVDKKSVAAESEKGKIAVAAPLDFTEKLTGKDSIEGFNRTMYWTNHFFVRWVFRPIGSVYGSIIPRPGIDAINRFTDNLGFPVRMFSCFCQAKFGGGGVEFLRFLSNTTLGVAGFFEVADPWFGLKRHDDDFGKAFYCWGIGNGCYLFLPGSGPSNIRAGTGKIFDFAFDPKSYIYFGQTFTYLNLGTRQYADYERMSLANGDPYQLFKNLGGIKRKLNVTDWTPVPENATPAPVATAKIQKPVKAQEKSENAAPSPQTAEFDGKVVAIDDYNSQSSALDTLRVAMFNMQKDEVSLWVDLSWWNSDFQNQGSVRSVKVCEDKSTMDYKVWYQDKKDAPLAIIVPGLGSHYSNTTAAALAEVLFARGYSVVTVSNAMNWEFMETAASTLVPGYTPVDASDVRNAVAMILDDLKSNKNLNPSRKVMIGYSLGALHSLFIANMETSKNTLGIDRYVAINPPVNLLYGMKQLDEYYATRFKWGDDSQEFERMLNAAGKYLMLLKRKYPWKGYPDASTAAVKSGNATNKNNKPHTESKSGQDDIYQVTLKEDEARVLVGYSFKMTLDEVIVSIHHRQNLGVLKTPYRWGSRTALYHELTNYSFDKYLNNFIIKYYSDKFKRQVTMEEMNRESSLTAIGPQLSVNSRVRVIHSMNDFLESDTDRIWLKNTFGEKIVFFKYGGHLGNLYLKQMHDSIINMLECSTPSVSQGAVISPSVTAVTK